MRIIEISIKETDNYENKEYTNEKRIIFMKEDKIKKLMKDKGLLGELLRETTTMNNG